MVDRWPGQVDGAESFGAGQVGLLRSYLLWLVTETTRLCNREVLGSLDQLASGELPAEG